jgi:uncharacterized protein (DUF1800 family)
MSVSPFENGPRAQAAHLLNRVGFGPRPGDIGRVLAEGFERYVESQVYPDADPEIQSRLAGLQTLDYTTGRVLDLYNADNRAIGVIVDEFNSAKLIRAVHARNQLQEVLVDFWFNHFNVNLNDGFVRYSITSYERDAIRPFVLGNFRDLLSATAHHSAMMYYLDNYLSTGPRVVGGVTRQGLNENYGRELLELHTVGVDAGYTQQDVTEAARVLTGWGIDNTGRSGQFMFRMASHDRGAKTVFGLSVPAGGGQEEGDRLIDYLADHPATAQYVSKRLVQRFVSDDPPASLVSRCADTFQGTGGDIARVMLTILGSREFWDPSIYGAKTKTPLEFAVSALRAVDAQVARGQAITPVLTAMGMPLYQCIPPTGYTNVGVEWLNPSSHLARVNFAFDVAGGATLAGVTTAPRAAAEGANLTSAASVATAVADELFGNRMSIESFEAASRVTAGGSVSVLARTLGLMLASPEFQAR